ncbi:MAG: ABC transporter ATP-binding protein [Acidobacteria bacterium]|nr:ABC transporter ATP-binding protein [Acidobacteriota bacterium]MBI3487159.1 ABC transporter ATP-binding protein [Acidobacteriota bacterium]
MIELQHVTKIYPGGSSGFKALDSIQLELPPGEFVAIVGKSGSGKSTLINLIAGLDRPTSGNIWVGGKPIHAMDETALATWRGLNVGVVFQFFQLLPTLTIAENVILPMDFCQDFSKRQARERALALLDQVGIADQADKLPTSLSGGQQQRAAIARALANDPPFIVADEPTGNLDSHTAEAVITQLAGLAEAGKTVLMVTHERDWAEFAHRVVTMADGRVVGRKLRVDRVNNLLLEADHV